MTDSITFVGYGSATSLSGTGVTITNTTAASANYITFSGATLTVGSLVAWHLGSSTYDAIYEGHYLSGGVEHPLLSIAPRYYLLGEPTKQSYPINSSSYDPSACYLQGTMIETDNGPVPVEMLHVGD